MVREEIADMMILKAERLDVEESEYICYHAGQPSTAELYELLRSRIPGKAYKVTAQINGITIKGLNMEKYLHQYQAEERAEFIREVCEKEAIVEERDIKNRHTDKMEHFWVVIVKE